jgi:pullulanase-type alpha-1,6-glucosidase
MLHTTRPDLMGRVDGDCPLAKELPVKPRHHARWFALPLVFALLLAAAGLPGGPPIASAAPEPGDQLLVRPSLTHPIQDSVFYFVLPDRFDNGDTGNDSGGIAGGPSFDGFLPSDKGYYHGGDLAGLKANLDYLESLGVTAIWMTPVFKNKPLQDDSSSPTGVSAGYHGYWITDFTQIDPHLGSNQELEALIDDAHSRGMKVFFDIITNHTADVIRYQDFETANSVPYRNKAAYPYLRSDTGEPFDDVAYASGNTFPPLDPETSFPYVPVVSGDEANIKVPSWLNDLHLYHNRGDTTYEGENSTYGDFIKSLDDLFTEHPQVVNGMIDIYKSWIDLGIDGYRIDTVKHVNIEFWQRFGPEIMAYAKANGKPDFFMYGEVFDGDPAFKSIYTTRGQLPATLDFGFQGNARDFASLSLPTNQLATFFAKDDYYTDADSNAYSLPTFLGNHDMGRFGLFLKQDNRGASDSELVARSRLAHALMFFARGMPVVYYGDEQGFVGDGGDKDARQDMMPSLVGSYNDDDLIGTSSTTAAANFDQSHPLFQAISAFAGVREAHEALRRGAQLHRYSQDSAGVYAFSRIGREEQVEYIVALNNAEVPASAAVQTFSSNASFTAVYPATAPALITGADGKLNLTVPALDVVVYRADAAVPASITAPTVAISAPAADALVRGRFEVAAAVEAGRFAEVTFAVKVGDAATYTVIGTDNNAPYRVFYDAADLAPGTALTFKAIVNDLTDDSGANVGAIDSATVAVTIGEDRGNNPDYVTIAGSLQSELGCPGDWQPDCAATQLTWDRDDDIWQASFSVPAGSWEYKVALNNSWDENYGANATPNGPNIALGLSESADVKFYYDHKTNWVTSNKNAVIAVAPGSFQSELGCPGDWDPSCLRSWLQDPDGDGTYTFRTGALPAGNYETKVAIDESWTENYGEGGALNGANIPFTVPADNVLVTFSYNPVSHLLTIEASGGATDNPDYVTIPGSFQSELGCPGDWQPDCANTFLTLDAADDVWQGTFDIPAGSWEYKAAIDRSWTENYGANATPNGPNIALNQTAAGAVKFYYDHKTNWVTSNKNAVIAVAPGNFQSELGCPGDWDPSCLRSWLQDPDGNGSYTFQTTALPAGNYEVKVAINESWTENYGAGGAPGGANIPFTVPSDGAPIFFSYDAVTHILTISDGAPQGNIGRPAAHWVAADTIAWNVGGSATGFRLHYAPEGGLTLGSDGVTGGESLALTRDPSGLSDAIKAKFPHLASYAALKLAPGDLAKVPAILKGQIAVEALGATGGLVDATGLQIPGVLDDLYAYEGALGVTFDRSTPTLRLWAPTAKSVRLHLFGSSTAPAATVYPMTADPATGVWSVVGTPSWRNNYYLYEVEVYVHATGKVERNMVTDPYSLSLSTNSARSQIVNLDDPWLKPPAWDAFPIPRLRAPEDTVIYELHVRDFSANDQSVPAPMRGTFSAFTILRSDGMRHLAQLGRDGLTHVHLLPAFDCASIDENKANWQTPDPALLATFGPAAANQADLVEATKDLDGFNWCYDPYHYTVPEGSYARNPDGSARILEFRQMVQALHRSKLRVVMDVVYNHTAQSGQDEKSVLDKVVPGYYHRLNPTTGRVETSTCCQNTATEHVMMEKLMIDSVLTWARAYKVTGFRFDLMGHHMKSNMLKLRAALDELTLARDGVDGRSIYLYGEGWDFGEVAANARGTNATQLNMAGSGIGTFSDRLRDAVRGGGPFDTGENKKIQGFVNGLYTAPNALEQGTTDEQKARLLLYQDQIKVGLAGNLASYQLTDRNGNRVTGAQVDYNGSPAGYTQDPQEVVTYIEAHDNETLFDKIQYAAPAGASIKERVRMQNLGISIVMLSQGVPFFQAGQDLLRSKSFDRNSYNSGDWFNRLDWTYRSNNWGVGLPPGEDNRDDWNVMRPLLENPALRPAHSDIVGAAAHFQEMLRIRSSSPLFRMRTAQDVQQRVFFLNNGPGQIPGLIVMCIDDRSGADLDPSAELICALFNADDTQVTFGDASLAGLRMRLHPVQAGSADSRVRTARFDSASGSFTVPARTTAVFVLR